MVSIFALQKIFDDGHSKQPSYELELKKVQLNPVPMCGARTWIRSDLLIGSE